MAQPSRATAPATLTGGIAGVLASAARAMRRRAMYRATVRELNALSSRELADLGIPRSMVTRVALEAARRVD